MTQESNGHGIPAAVPSDPSAPRPANRQRPSGLTIMAILNFVFGGLGIIALFVLAVVQDQLNKLTGGQLLTWANYLMLFMRLVTVVLAICSGVGYLGMKRLTGWVLGNAYASVAILNSILYAVLLEQFGIMTFVWTVYPILTLIMLNLVFRQDFHDAEGRPPVKAVGIALLAAVGVIAVAGLVLGRLTKPGEKVFTDIKVRIAPSLRQAEEGKTPKAAYAEMIRFPQVSVKPAGIKDLRLDWLVRNDGDRTVTRLEVRISLQDERGVELAGDTDLFAHSLPFGENNTPVQAHSTKQAGGELENARDWKRGKIVVTIIDIEVE